MKINHPLMHNNFSNSDMNAVRKLIRNKNLILTQSKKVLEFEKKWSKWLGVKYSVFVNSGSSANFITMLILKSLSPKRKEIIVPTLTWVSDINSVIMSGFKPVFVDIDPKNLSMNEEQVLKKINKNTLAVFITHVQGFNGLSERLLKKIKNKKVMLIEDVCESHGATYKGKMCGTLTEGSTFSFYFGHHMTTVEGGFVCTNDDKLYNLMKMKRSHGMAREATHENYKRYQKEYPEVHPMFMFMTDGYNLRNMEINAVLGSSQLKNLTKNNEIRKVNFSRFINMVSKYPNILFSVYKEEGNSSFCFPFICKTPEVKNQLEKYLSDNGVETRPLCSGNLLRQPFLIKDDKIPSPDRFPIAEALHNNGFFIGNNHMITEEDWVKLETLLENYGKQ